MPRASLHHVAELLPVRGEARVLKPHWMNPAVEGGGAGLEFRTDLPVGQLITAHRKLLIACTYAAQFLVVRCPVGEPAVPLPWKQMLLGPQRPEDDMIWHTDRVQRDQGAVTAVVGRSSVRTGIGSKPLVAQAVADRRTVRDEVYALKNSLRALQLYENERQGKSPLYRDDVSQHLGDVYEGVMEPQIGYPLKRIIDGFWAHIRAVNAHEDFLWIGEPDEDPDEPVVFLSRTVYHCKEFTPLHYHPRDGTKRRIDIILSECEREAIDGRFRHLTHAQPDPVETDWLRDIQIAS